MRTPQDKFIRAMYAAGLREARFWRRVDMRSDGCWWWTGPIDNSGYGRISDLRVHRYAYELLVAPIPAGLQVDHLCRNTVCCNPRHLEAVTGSENTRRAFARKKARQAT